MKERVYKALLARFEQALRRRNPILADRLQPGLPEARVWRILERAKVEGAIEPVVELFTWKNGGRLDPTIAEQHESPFPDSAYIYMDLQLMLAHFVGFREGALYHSRITELVDRYFPIFWNGSDGWIATDLRPSQSNRVVLVDAQADKPVRPAYDSFDQFLKDAIRANEKNDRLECFK